jgi:Kef-type K+ transport system membrane component KefB
MSSTTGMFLIAMGIIFTVPYAIWRFARTDYYAPLVVVQIIMGILLGPGILGKFFPDQHAHVFNAPVVQSLTGIAWWSVMLFVWIAGIELDLKKAWENRRESLITAGLALSAPLLLGAIVGLGMAMQTGWMGPAASRLAVHARRRDGVRGHGASHTHALHGKDGAPAAAHRAAHPALCEPR